jgi:hypothetical protein
LRRESTTPVRQKRRSRVRVAFVPVAEMKV